VGMGKTPHGVCPFSIPPSLRLVKPSVEGFSHYLYDSGLRRDLW